MRFRFISLLLLWAGLVVQAQDDIRHQLQAGDTWQSLEATYNTCREAIIYHNGISLTSIYSEYYVMSAGTTFTIPPKSACDDLPQGEIIHTVLIGETPRDLFAKYRQAPNHFGIHYMPDETNSIGNFIFPEDFLEPGTKLIVPTIELFYQNDAELIVIDDASYYEPIIHRLQGGDTLAYLADQYQTCVRAIIWENRLTLARPESVAFVFNEGDTLIIPPATACDDLPFGEYTIRLDEATTQLELIRQYRQNFHSYFELNDAQEGLLPTGTEQIIPYVQMIYDTEFELVVVSETDQPQAHILKRGDTFSMLELQYQTCVEAIIYANNLKRTSTVDPTFKVKAGTELTIPPASACDEIPDHSQVYTVQEGDTLFNIAYRFNTSINAIIEASVYSPLSPMSRGRNYLKHVNRIEPGMIFVIPDVSGQYHLRDDERLLVYDEDDVVIYASPNLSLSEFAQCFGVDYWDLFPPNGFRDVRFNGGSLIIPNAQHECILRDYWGGVLACYTQAIETIVSLESDYLLLPTLISRQDGAYCYEKTEIYELLFHDKPVILYDWLWSRRVENEETWSLTMDMINFCFRHDKDLLRDITFDEYDTSILPPDDHIKVFALPDHITCNQEMFNDYYVYRVRPYDTLNNIARAYGTHPDWIADANQLDNPNIIYVGQYLQIPTPTLFHVLQGTGGLSALVLIGWGLRRLVRRRNRRKVKRKVQGEV